MAMYRLKEQREMKPRAFAQLITTMLYEKRFGPYFIEPVIAGLEKVTAEDGTVSWEPYLTATDLIGAGACDFVDNVTTNLAYFTLIIIIISLTLTFCRRADGRLCGGRDVQ